MICWIACTVPTMAGTTRRRLAGTGSPVSSGMRAGTSRRCSSSVTYWPGALSRINCYRAGRLVRSRLTGLCSAMRTLRCAATACMGQWVFVTHWRSTPGAVPTSTLTGLFSPGLPITSSRLVQCVMCSTRTSTRDLRHAGVFRRPAVGQPAHSADKFRKLYYDNGSHAGCIVYVNSAMADQESIDSLKKTLTDTRRGGAFKNVLLHARWR